MKSVPWVRLWLHSTSPALICLVNVGLFSSQVCNVYFFKCPNATSYKAVSVQELFTSICSTFLCTLGLHSEENKQFNGSWRKKNLIYIYWTRWRNRVLQFESLLWCVEFTTYHFNTKFDLKVWSLDVWKEDHHGKFRNLNFTSLKQF